MSREAACQALFALVSGAYAWKQDPSRRLKLWADVSKDNRPCFYQFEGAPETYVWDQRGNIVVPRRQLSIKLFFYVTASDSDPGAPQLNAILDAVDAAIQPTPAVLQQFRRQVLPVGSPLVPTVDFCRIAGVPLKDPGDIDGDGMAIVDIEMQLP